MIWSELRTHAPILCVSTPVSLEPVTLSAGGLLVGADQRLELLAKVRGGEQVDLQIDLLAFEQMRGVRNRKSVRIRDGSLMAFGRSGRGTPLMRDHEQSNLLARCGTVTHSETRKLGDGHYRIHQSGVITAPWAVEAALLGNLDRFSVGWSPTGDVLCSVCNTPILTACRHVPGMELDGKDGPVFVEWIYTSADLVETSAVSVPAVPTTEIEGIRAALSAVLTAAGEPPRRNVNRIATLLGLAATAGDDDIARAVERLGTERTALQEQLGTARTALAESAARLAAHEALALSQAEDAFIDEGIRGGKIIRGSHETSLRAYFRQAPEGARAMLASAPSLTPVGQPRQSARAEPEAAPGGTLAQREMAEAGFNYELVRAQLSEMGVKDPDAVLARRYGKAS